LGNNSPTPNHSSFADSNTLVYFDSCSDPNIILDNNTGDNESLVDDILIWIAEIVICGVDAYVRRNPNAITYLNTTITVNNYALIEGGTAANAYPPWKPDCNPVTNEG
jgi:hypothetical protein